MNILLEHLKNLSAKSPDQIVVKGIDKELSAQDLFSAVSHLSQNLLESDVRVVGIYANNSPSWIVIDLACQMANICLLPLPSFFSDQQLSHAIATSNLDCMIADNDERIPPFLPQDKPVSRLDIVTDMVCWKFDRSATDKIPANTNKITFTSGSTGTPKGVCLSNDSLLSVAQALTQKINISNPKHLSLLPYSMLLENIAGIYVPLLSDGLVYALPPETIGIGGSSNLDIATMLGAITRYQPNSIILIPELLKVLMIAIEHSWLPPATFQFIAVGGGKVSPELIEKARDHTLPVYEGYGLSECASVVSLNCPSEDCLGTVGKPLTHVDLDIVEGEIVVGGNSFLGYIDEPDSWSNSQIKTGDIGHFNKQGFLVIDGRKKNILISSFGRNIHPEWVESEICGNAHVAQCFVFGDDKPYLTALIASYAQHNPETESLIESWISSLNRSLPDYAQVKSWYYLRQPLTKESGLLTSNGRPKREKIYETFEKTIEELYSESNEETIA
ncbi:MAG: long-chain acyl-CoA synthetase [Gammaproteobacteria bacterium]|jgi:long-chain acyl-CoA synthetase